MRRRDMMQTGLAWAGLALAPVATVWAARDDRGYKIQRATYGTDRRSVDVTQRMLELARRDERFMLKNQVFGVDPDNKRVKTLRIIATDPRGLTRVFEFTEGSWVDGAQFSGWEPRADGETQPNRPSNQDSSNWEPGNRDEYRILRAQYGTAERHIDVTRRLRELAAKDVRFLLRNETFGTDPHPGRPKVLRIYARNRDGQMRTFEYAESSWVDGSAFSGWGAGNWGRDGERGGWDDSPPSGYGDDGLRIVFADYGADNRRMDITERLRQQVQNGRLNVKVSNSMAGGDPADGSPKQLRITYSVNGRERHRVWNEGDLLSLP